MNRLSIGQTPLSLALFRKAIIPPRLPSRPETIMSTAAARVEAPNDLEAFWLPFTPNRAFKKAPRLISRSKDMHFYTPEGREILDATAALWCCNAGHNRTHIVEAIQRQAGESGFLRRRSSSPIRWCSARCEADGDGARRSRPCVFHQFGLRSRRHRAEDRASPITMCGARARASV